MSPASRKLECSDSADDGADDSSRLLILDGHGLAYRSYYALEKQDLRDPHTQERTQAIHGFFRMLIKLLKDFTPSHLLITWDTPATTFRRKLFPAYKAGRKPTPPDLIAQVARIKELAAQCGFCNLQADGYEADDIIGTVATAYAETLPVLIVSSDKDCFQLLSQQIRMIRPVRGVNEFDMVDPQWLKSEKGVEVKQVPDFFSLTGDSADNIPGVAGIGEKTATKLLQQFSSLEKIYENLHQIRPVSLQQKLVNGKDSAFFSRRLFLIDRAVPIWQHGQSSKTQPAGSSPEVPKTQSEIPEAPPEIPTLPPKTGSKLLQSYQLPNSIPIDGITKFHREGFQQIATQLEKWNEQQSNPTRMDLHHESLIKNKKYKLIASLSELEALTKKMADDLSHNNHNSKTKQFIAIDTETTGLDTRTADLLGISLSYVANEAYYIPLRPPKLAQQLAAQAPDQKSPFSQQFLPYNAAKKILSACFRQPERGLIGQNIRYDLRILNEHGFAIPCEQASFDTMIASYLCLPNMRFHNLTDMTRIWLGQDKLDYKDVLASTKSQKKAKNFSEIPPQDIAMYACEDADVTWQLYQTLSKELQKKKLQTIFSDLEMPLLFILMGMEDTGVRIDIPYLKKLQQDFEKRLQKHQQKIHDLVGFSFNILSTRELQKVLFQTLNMPMPKRKIKTGHSIDQQALEGLQREANLTETHRQVIDEILEYRKVTKLISTYIEKLIHLADADKDHRVHTTYSQTIAATGRLSSFHPNLQNIPRNETSGRSIRKAFIAAKNCSLLAVDYSQIELRILAHFSGDEKLIQCYREPSQAVDVHLRTAAALFALPEKQINSEQRNVGKVLNFSIIYGATEFGLSKSLNISMTEAKSFIERFFAAYPKVKEYIDQTIEQAKEQGYVSTLWGRRRPTPEVRDAQNFFARKAAERTAVNAPIQGTSADIIKQAMIQISHRLAVKPPHQFRNSVSNSVSNSKNTDLKKTSGMQHFQTRMLLQVHDELLFEVPQEERAQILPLVIEEMENAAQIAVPLVVKYGWGNNWDEAELQH